MIVTISNGKNMSKPLVVAISGASGVIYGVEMLRALQTTDCPAHLILSESAGRNLQIEGRNQKALANRNCHRFEGQLLAHVGLKSARRRAKMRTGSDRANA